MKNEVLSILPKDFPWAEYLQVYDSLPSTNDALKHFAQTGAPQGTAILARSQSAGRGRMGRSFCSQENKGMYLSVLLRPGCAPAQLMHLTCAVAVAACDAVEATSGMRPQIKWINDLVAGGKKLGGILTELSIDTQTGLVDQAIVGIGINCLQESGDFPKELSEIATSLLLATGKTVSPAKLAGAILIALEKVCRQLFTKKSRLMEHYRENCLTIGKQVQISTAQAQYTAFAEGITEDGSLILTLPDGTRHILASGEASVRGMYGYV